MKFCISCFRPELADAVRLIVGDATSRGPCDFCDAKNVDLWEVGALADAFTGLIQNYEAADEAVHVLAEQIQIDWQLFASDNVETAHKFLNAIFDGNNKLVAENPNARLRAEDGAEAADHVATWENLKKELIESNRFFPTLLAPGSDNWEFFREIIESRCMEYGQGSEFYRARISPTADGFPADEMSMPQPGQARAGRANPVGIPHLYLAEAHMTCLYESRAVRGNYVTVAKFVATGELTLLDLKHRAPLNPFRAMLDGDAAANLDVHRTIEHLGRGLQEPLRPTDTEVEYVPTQYLSSLVKSLGMDGILFGSAMHTGGTNVVLFDASKVEVRPEVTIYEIEGLDLREKRLIGPDK